MPINEFQAELDVLRKNREAAETEAARTRFAAQAAAARIDDLKRRARGDRTLARRLAELEEEAKRGDAAANAASGAAADVRRQINDKLGLLGQITPQDLIRQLDDRTPFLLMPVRIETKFARNQRQTQLRIRIFPDTFAISTHEPQLTADEYAAGQTFWTERARAAQLASAQDRLNATHGAWTVLANRFGAARASWILHATKPTNWDDDHPPAPDALTFPPPGDLKPAAWTAAPHSRVLPDRFVAMALVGNAIVQQAIGQPIRDDLVLGPDPLQQDSFIRRDPVTHRIVADERLAWLIDYDKAVGAGLAITLNFDGPLPQDGIDQVIVLGIKSSSDSASAATLLEKHFDDLHFTRGIDIPPQGTPTNNTERAPSGFDSSLEAAEAMFASVVAGEEAVSVTDHIAKSDSQRLAEALGVDFSATKTWQNAARRDIAEALAMNRALWPATIGSFSQVFMSPLVDNATRRELERFFVTFVTGRSLLPAIRVANQPYGVLTTAAFSRWTMAPAERRGDQAAFLTQLENVLDRLTQDARALAANVAAINGGDPFEQLMRVIGLQASSVAYFERKAVTDRFAWNALAYRDLPSIIRNVWWTILQSRRNAALAALGLGDARLKIRTLTYTGLSGQLTGPVVDRDPDVPLSETAGIIAFDGVRTYIDWLLTASAADIGAELFRDADGKALPPPRALLYQYLRHAWLATLTPAVKEVALRLRPELAIGAGEDAEIMNVGPAKSFADDSVLQIDTARIGAANLSRPLGEYLLDLGRAESPWVTRPPEALPIATMADALRVLAKLPTARLERAFAEHVDLCSHRLDAWKTALVARRLDLLRRQDNGARGIYIGAYGFVEKLRPQPEPAVALSNDVVPASLREDGIAVFSQPRNGGFVQAPSMNHAVTAAILRNGYLTHAEPERAEAMSVNLSSARVRQAMTFIEGMRAGQELGALLGYQLERGLHENHPGAELDSLIWDLRARFPFISKRLTDVPDGTAAEVIEARNVINGYDLVEHVRGKDYPYSLTELPTIFSSDSAADRQRKQAQINAISAEFNRLEDILDSINDLMFAESVHQAVLGNVDRTRGVIQSLTEGDLPPVPEIAQTPRSGAVITQRAVLHLPPPVMGWVNPPTPRATANPRVNTWLAAMLPAPTTIAISIGLTGQPIQQVTLADSGLDAVDVVLMCGETIGDGSSELERWIVETWRAGADIAPEIPTFYGALPAGFAEQAVVFDPATSAGVPALKTVLPYLKALRRLVTTARPLHALDYRLSSESQRADPANPKGYVLDGGGDPSDLRERVRAAATDLETNVLVPLEGVLDQGALTTAYEALLDDPGTFDSVLWTPALAALRNGLRKLSLFGMPEALPATAAGINAETAETIYAQAAAVTAAARKRLDAAVTALPPPPLPAPTGDPVQDARNRASALDQRIAALTEAGRALLGKPMTLAPLFRFETDAVAEIAGRIATPIESDPIKIDTWLQSLARVRKPIANLNWIVNYRRWTGGTEPTLLPIQLPANDSDPWIAATFATPPVSNDVLALMAVDGPANLGADQCGLMIDDWTEVVPTAKETTGIAFHFNRPNAAPPQALLLAVSPNLDGHWDWDDLVATIRDTMELARIRAIEPEQIAGTNYFHVLPATLVQFATGGGLSTLLSHNSIVRGAMTIAPNP